MTKLTLSSLIAAACLAGVQQPVQAQMMIDESLQDSIQIPHNIKPTGKISSRLQSLHSAQTFGPKTKLSSKAQDAAPVSGLMPIALDTANGMVVIDAIANGNAEQLLADLQAMGLKNGSSFGNVVSGSMPIGQLDALNAMPNLVTASPAIRATNVGLVTTQGDEAQASDIARSQFGVDGSGVIVGSLSDSFDCTAPGEAAIDEANNDLPAGVNVLLDIESGCIDEGRAMMQLVHDVAPGSKQAFHTAFTGQAGFANGIIALQEDAGADIIVDDVIYFTEPMFQDGIIAQAAQQVADNGSAFFSSAGNGSFNSWEGAFVPGGLLGPYLLHDFDPGPDVDVFQSFLLTPGNTSISFQWDQPYASATGGGGSASDLDILLFANGTFLGQFSGLNINTGADPIELIQVGVNGPVLIELAIGLFEGPIPNVIKYVHFGSDQRVGGGPLEYATRSATSYGHSNAANMAGVGASAFFNTAAFNDFCQPACINSFSALGGVPILFDENDNPVNIVRERPNFVGPDGGNTTFFGGDLSFPVDGTNEPDGFGNFFGTSASAPHAAAAAALIKQTNPSLSPAEIYALLETTATDMTTGEGSGPGFDFRTGYGFINVDAAVEAAGTDPGNANKRFVCHNNDQSLSISKNAVQAHLAHGDKFGPCE